MNASNYHPQIKQDMMRFNIHLAMYFTGKYEIPHGKAMNVSQQNEFNGILNDLMIQLKKSDIDPTTNKQIKEFNNILISIRSKYGISNYDFLEMEEYMKSSTLRYKYWDEYHKSSEE